MMRTTVVRYWPAAACVAFVGLGCYEWMATAFAFFGSQRLLWFHQDFPALYTAAHMVAHGSGSLLYDRAAVGAEELRLAGHPVGATGMLAYFNPAFFAALLAPISSIGMDDAYQVWMLLGFVLLGADVVLLWRIGPHLSPRERALVTLAFLTLYPVSYGLQAGQFSLLLMTSWGAAYLLWRSGRDEGAGLALSPLLIKPELLVPVALFVIWKRRWRVLKTLLPVATILIVVSVIVTGVPAALAYPQYLLHSGRWSDSGVATSGMFNWSGIVAMWWDPAKSPQALVAVAVLIVLTLAAVAYVARERRGGHALRPELQWLLLTIATILVDPHLYLQDSVLIVPAAVAVIDGARPKQRPWVFAAALLGWTLLALGIYPNERLHVDAFALYMVAAAITVVALDWRRRIRADGRARRTHQAIAAAGSP